MVGQRMPEQLGAGEWVLYTYKAEPGKLYCVGPYTAEEADTVAVMFRTDPYKRQGFRSVERLGV